MWLYIPTSNAEPSTASPSAPASEVSTSDCNSLTIISERLFEASVLWRSKPRQPQAWSRLWKRGGFIRLLSGLTLEPSTAQLGADVWISSLRATRARGTASPENGAANSTIAGCSTAPSTSSTPAGLILSSARTCRGTPTDNLPLPSRHWSDWVAALRSEYSARPKPAIRCGGSDCSSSRDDRWPTPVVQDDQKSPDAHLAMKKRMGERDGSGANRTAITSLTVMVKTWEPPTEHWRAPSDISKRGGSQPPDKRSAGGHTVNLEDQAEHWMAPRTVMGAYTRDGGDPTKERLTLEGQATHWLAPLVADAGEKITLASHQGSLIKQANDFHPPSSPDHPIIAAGSTSSTDSPNSNQPSVKRKLNPIFVEALMRWPTGLSGFERQETAWTRWWQQQRSFLSDLASPVIDQHAQMEMF